MYESTLLLVVVLRYGVRVHSMLLVMMFGFQIQKVRLALGVTTATKGAAVFEFRLPVHIEVGSDVYLFFKMMTGSCVVDKTTITWSE
jgi:hypothetical protein